MQESYHARLLEIHIDRHLGKYLNFSNKNDEPPHVHFEKGKAIGKSWLDPVEVAYWIGFKTSEKE